MAIRTASTEKRTFSDITLKGVVEYNGNTTFDASASGFANPIGDGRVAMTVSLSTADLTGLCNAAKAAKHDVVRLSVFQLERRAKKSATTPAAPDVE